MVAIASLLAWVVLADPTSSERRSERAALRAPTTPVGFGQPKVLTRTPKGAEIDDPVVAVSPTGSTAVLWRTASGLGRGETYSADYLIATGPDAAHLSSPRAIPAARRAARATGSSELLAQPDGGFVACFGEDRRRGAATIGCTFAAAGGRFGPLRVVARSRWENRPTMTAAVRADGTVLVLVSRVLGKARRSVELTALSPLGRLMKVHRLGEVRGDTLPTLGTTTDGTAAVAWSNGPAGSIEGDLTPVLRLMPPGTQEFGPPVAFSTDRQVTSGVGLTGGAALLVDYTTGFLMDGAEERIVRRLPDGTFTAPRTLPRPGRGFVGGGAIPLPDGTPLAVVASDEQSETDCGDSTGGVVGAGPLVDLGSPTTDDSGTRGPITAERLSHPKQIAQYPSGAVLEDGTVIVAWSNAAGRDGAARVEVATRPPGAAAFNAPQVLPRDAVFGGQALAAGSDQALLAWTVGAAGAREQIMVSALRTAPPFAEQQRRPAKPKGSCS